MGKKENKIPRSKTRKIIDWTITGIFGALFVLLLVYQIIANVSKGSNYGVPTFNGFQTLVVLTDSMEPEYKVGSACFVMKQDPSTYKEGDDLTFYYSNWKSYMDNPIVTHRVLTITVNPDIEVGSGRYTFTLHGINTDSDQAWEVSGHKTRDCTYQTQTVTEKEVLGKVIGNSTVVGGLYSFFTSVWGLITLILVPTIYLIVSYGIDIYKAAKEEETALETGSGTAPNSNQITTLSKEDKERLKAELLEEMLKEKEKQKNENK